MIGQANPLIVNPINNGTILQVAHPIVNSIIVTVV